MIKTSLQLSLLVLLFPVLATAQKTTQSQPGTARTTKTITVPLKAESWIFRENKVQFLEYKSRPSLKILPEAGPVVLKNLDFTDGTIEFDHEPINPSFASMYFHCQDEKENECFYFRTGRADNPTAVDAVQYAPYLDGVNLWDLLDHYQGPAHFSKQSWNHVKLVISGKQMRVYVNSERKPTLEIPRLEGNATHGTIAFDGEAIISNLVIKPNQTQGLSPGAGIDPTDHDPRYLRNWQVSQPTLIPKGIDFSQDLVPGKETAWQAIEAERRGLINLTRPTAKAKPAGSSGSKLQSSRNWPRSDGWTSALVMKCGYRSTASFCTWIKTTIANPS